MGSRKTFRQTPLAYFLGILLCLEPRRALSKSLVKLKFCYSLRPRHYARSCWSNRTTCKPKMHESYFSFQLRAFWSSWSFLIFSSFYLPVHQLNLVQKGNLNIHPTTCLRTGSWSSSASWFGLPLALFFLFFVFISDFIFQVGFRFLQRRSVS